MATDKILTNFSRLLSSAVFFASYSAFVEECYLYFAHLWNQVATTSYNFKSLKNQTDTFALFRFVYIHLDAEIKVTQLLAQ